MQRRMEYLSNNHNNYNCKKKVYSKKIMRIFFIVFTI